MKIVWITVNLHCQQLVYFLKFYILEPYTNLLLFSSILNTIWCHILIELLS